MQENIIKEYEDLCQRKSPEFDNIMKAVKIVKYYVIRNKKIIVGGLAINLALEIKKVQGIYDEDALMDIDIITDTHFKDAYEIATILAKGGFAGISVINALHPSTMRVRVDFKDVCDITYVPKRILENIPVLQQKGFTIVHPHYQIIDQHRSLMYPYENAPFETVLNRPEKDMIRYDKLYELYPLKILNVLNTRIDLKEDYVNIELLHNQCISGFFALNYWILQAKQMGFKTNLNFGHYNLQGTKINYKMPSDSNGLTIYSDNIITLYETVLKEHKSNNIKFYNRFLDKLPRKIIIDNKFELLENNKKMTAFKINIKESTVYIADLQSIMIYLLTNYILIMKVDDKKRSYSFYIGYILCRDMLIWASALYEYDIVTNINRNNKLLQFLPTAQTYGTYNLSDSFIVARHTFDIKNKTLSQEDRKKYAQPHHVYDRDLIYKKVPKKYYEFNVDNSDIFNFNGKCLLEKWW